MKIFLKFWSALLDRHPSAYWWISLFWLGLLSYLAFFAGLGSLGLTDKTEALFVEVARQMAIAGDWITPRWNGEAFFDYPIWGYWMVALSFKLFGFHEWAARLPTALAAISVVVAVFFLLRFGGLAFGETTIGKRQGWFRSWLGAGILALTPGWIGWGRTAVTDMFLSSAVALSLISFFWGYRQTQNVRQQNLAYILASCFAAIAFLAKGPIGILLPGLTIFSFLLYVGQFQAVRREAPWSSMIVAFILIASPWYVLAAQANGMEFLGTFFGFSNFQRFTNVLYRHAGPWYFYLPWIAILILPWSLFLPLSIARLQFWRRKAWQTTPRAQHLGLFCGFWFAVILAFFSAAATKLAGYILPLVPAGSLLISLSIAELWAIPPESPLFRRWPFLLSFGLNVVLLGLMAIAAYISPQLVAGDPATPNFESLLRTSGLPWIFSAILGLAAISCIPILIRPSWRKGWWMPNAAAFLLTLTFVIPSLTQLLDSQTQQPSRIVAQSAGQAIEHGERIFVIGYLRYSIVYYSQQPVTFLDDVHYVRELPSQAYPAASTVLLIGEKRILDRLNLLPSDYQVLTIAFPYHLWRVDKRALMQRP